MADRAPPLSSSDAALLRFLNAPFVLVIPPLLAVLAAMLWGISQMTEIRILHKQE